MDVGGAVQVCSSLAMYVAAGIMPVTSILSMFSSQRLLPLQSFPLFERANLIHFTMTSLQYLEAKTTKKTVQLMFEAQKASQPIETKVTRPHIPPLNEQICLWVLSCPCGQTCHLAMPSHGDMIGFWQLCRPSSGVQHEQGAVKSTC